MPYRHPAQIQHAAEGGRSGAPAAAIAELYKRRWAIELFFRWVKQTLKIRRFLGTSENAVRIQIAVALIPFLLLRLAQPAQ
jgi:IS4 transposase